LNLSLIIRRLGITLLLAFVIFTLAVFINEDVAGFLFLPCWAALFFGWPYLSRRLNFNFPKAPAPRQPRRADWSRILITGVLALLLASALALVGGYLFGPSYLCLWFALYYGWPVATRRLTILNFLDRKPPVGVRPLWLRLIRGTFAWAGGIVLALVLIFSVTMTPLFLCHPTGRKRCTMLSISG
jgi:hypothetical protein